MGRISGGSVFTNDKVDKLVIMDRAGATYIRARLVATDPGTYIVALVTGPDTFYSSMVTIETPQQSTNPGISLNPLFEPMINVPESDILGRGWSICYQDTYDVGGVALNSIFSACSGPNIMLACRPVDDPNFTVASFASFNDVTRDTNTAPGDTTTTRNANGAEWYFNPGNAGPASWGFAAAGDFVNKSACDNLSTGKNNMRLCWNIGAGGTLESGYRCGATEALFDNTWERVILHHY